MPLTWIWTDPRRRQAFFNGLNHSSAPSSQPCPHVVLIVRRSRPADRFNARGSSHAPGLRSIAMRALLVTSIVVLLLLSRSTSAASATSAADPAPLACGAAGTPATMTKASTPVLAASPAPASDV